MRFAFLALAGLALGDCAVDSFATGFVNDRSVTYRYSTVPPEPAAGVCLDPNAGSTPHRRARDPDCDEMLPEDDR